MSAIEGGYGEDVAKYGQEPGCSVETIRYFTPSAEAAACCPSPAPVAGTIIIHPGAYVRSVAHLVTVACRIRPRRKFC